MLSSLGRVEHRSMNLWPSLLLNGKCECVSDEKQSSNLYHTLLMDLKRLVDGMMR